MDTPELLTHFNRLADAPGAIPRLRRLVLDLAVRGKLVAQDPGDEPAVAPSDVLPRGWRWMRLQELGSLKGGGTPSKACEEYWTGEIPWVSPKDMKIDYIDAAQMSISRRAIQESAVQMIPRNSILFVVRGMILAHSFPVAIAKAPLTINQDMKALVLDQPEFSEYILRALKGLTPAILRHVQRSSHGTCRIESVHYMNFIIPIPPLAEQHRIVAKVDELMGLLDQIEARQTAREATRRQLTAASLARLSTSDTSPDELRDHARFLLDYLPAHTTRRDQIKQLRQTILNLAVRGRLVPQEATSTDACSDSKPGLPAGWRKVRLRDLGMLKGGGTPSKSRDDFWAGDIPWVSPKDMKTDYIHSAQMSITPAAVRESAVQIIPPNSILFVVRGMILAHSFPVAINKVPATINQDMKALVLRQPEFAEYVLRALMGLKPEMLKRVQRSSHGTCRIEGDDYSDFPVPIPPLAEQHRIVAKVNELMTLCDHLDAALARAETSRTRLLDAELHAALQDVEAA